MSTFFSSISTLALARASCAMVFSSFSIFSSAFICSIPNKAVLALSEEIAITPMVRTEIIIPLSTVSKIEVCLGRKPNTDIRFLPILLPILSAM